MKSAKYQVGPAAANGPFAPGRQVATLALGHVSRLQPQAGLARLLDALLPDSAPLDCLLLEHCALSAPALRDCPRLAALPAMTLRHCSDGGIAAAFGGDTELGPALEQLLGQAASLTALELQGRLDYGGLPTLPRALVEKAGIRWLRLRHNYLEELPAGPWLQSAQGRGRGMGCVWFSPAASCFQHAHALFLVFFLPTPPCRPGDAGNWRHQSGREPGAPASAGGRTCAAPPLPRNQLESSGPSLPSSYLLLAVLLL